MASTPETRRYAQRGREHVAIPSPPPISQGKGPSLQGSPTLPSLSGDYYHAVKVNFHLLQSHWRQRIKLICITSSRLLNLPSDFLLQAKFLSSLVFGIRTAS